MTKAPKTRTARPATNVRYGRCAENQAAHMKRLKRHGKWFARDILHTNPEARKRLMEPGRNGRAVNARYLYFAVLYHIVLESKGQKVVARYCNTSSPTVHNGLKKVHVALANEGDAALQHRAHRLCKRLRIEPEKLQLFVQKINERPRPT